MKLFEPITFAFLGLMPLVDFDGCRNHTFDMLQSLSSVQRPGPGLPCTLSRRCLLLESFLASSHLGYYFGAKKGDVLAFVMRILSQEEPDC